MKTTPAISTENLSEQQRAADPLAHAGAVRGPQNRRATSTFNLLNLVEQSPNGASYIKPMLGPLFGANQAQSWHFEMAVELAASVVALVCCTEVGTQRSFRRAKLLIVHQSRDELIEAIGSKPVEGWPMLGRDAAQKFAVDDRSYGVIRDIALRALEQVNVVICEVGK